MYITEKKLDEVIEGVERKLGYKTARLERSVKQLECGHGAVEFRPRYDNAYESGRYVTQKKVGGSIEACTLCEKHLAVHTTEEESKKAKIKYYEAKIEEAK